MGDFVETIVAQWERGRSVQFILKRAACLFLFGYEQTESAKEIARRQITVGGASALLFVCYSLRTLPLAAFPQTNNQLQ
jgi:hypothetical protein